MERATLVHMLNGNEICLNTTHYPIFNMQNIRYWLAHPFWNVWVRWYPLFRFLVNDTMFQVYHIIDSMSCVVLFTGLSPLFSILNVQKYYILIK